MLYYGLVCTAIDEDKQKLREGMRLLANIAHKYNIPISWAINAGTAQFLAKDLTAWHHEYGDEPLLMLDIRPVWLRQWYSIAGKSASDQEDQSEDINKLYETASTNTIAEHLVKMREAIPRYISAEWKKVTRAIAWAIPNVAGAEWKNHVLVQALEQEGFRGLWGYRWDERGAIAEVDRGCPFGFFYPSKEQHNFSTPAAGSIAGIPFKTAAHLQKEEHNLRSELINDILQKNFDLYLENVKWNRWLSYVEHIDVMEAVQLGQETLAKLDAYFAHIAGNERTKVLPLSEIVDDYWSSCQMTEPTYIVKSQAENQTESVIDASDIPQSNSEGKSTGKDSRKSFSYYDAECQYTFVEGIMEPVEMKNYISPPVLENVGYDTSQHSIANYGIEYHLPKVTDFRPNRKRAKLHIYFTIESTKSMPYGVAVWGNHRGLQLAESNAKDVVWVDETLLFIRLALVKGENDFEVVLTI